MNYLTKRAKCSDVVVLPERIRTELGDIQSLALSILKYGLLNPITVTDKLVLIAGERRLTAVRDQLKHEEIDVRIPCEEGEPLDELAQIEMEVVENAHRKTLTYGEECEEIRRYHRCAIKKAGQAIKGKGAGWGVRDTAVALGKSVGFVSQALQLADAIDRNPGLATAENKVSAFKQMKRDEERAANLAAVEVVKKCGFTPECLMLGDNLPILKKWTSSTVAYINADPPYGIKYGEDKVVTDRWGDVYAIQDIPHEVFNNLELVLRECFRILLPGGHLHLWFHMQHYIVLYSMLKGVGFEVNPVPFFWVKSKHGGGISDHTHSNATEPAFHAWKGEARKCTKAGQLNYSLVEKVPDQSKIHPTEKPTQLYRPMIEQYSKENEPCLDPYAGSASFLRACFQTGRDGRGIEMKKEHYDAAVAALVKEMAQLAEEPRVVVGSERVEREGID